VRLLERVTMVGGKTFFSNEVGCLSSYLLILLVH
jgi:hypothetical protein